MTIDINLVKKLRDSTSAPLGDCKEALTQSSGDLEQAKERLKKKWLSQAAKKSDRETNEWITKFEKRGDKIVGIKLLCETDFVAKNDLFAVLVDDIFEMLFASVSNAKSLTDVSSDIALQLTARVTDSVATLWENMRLDDVFVMSGNAVVYNHPGYRIASVVFYESLSSNSESIAKDVALQVAAMNPFHISMDDVDSQEKDSFMQSAKDELASLWKPESVIDTIAMGKMTKYYSDIVLLEQSSIKDDSKKIREYIEGSIRIQSIHRFSI